MELATVTEHINWHFNPPAAPHFGGLWEAGIRSVKGHLARTIGNQIVTFEECYTLLTIIEATLNSRPLCAMSSDITDINALTPAHFLTLEPVSPLPTPVFSQIEMNRLTRFQLIQRLHQDLWKRWHKEYLHTLQQRGKWLEPTSSPKPGVRVLVKNENLPPANWLMARIISVTKAIDGQVRVAEVKTSSGTLVRPLVKLCPLPMNDQQVP